MHSSIQTVYLHSILLYMQFVPLPSLDLELNCIRSQTLQLSDVQAQLKIQLTSDCWCVESAPVSVQKFMTCPNEGR